MCHHAHGAVRGRLGLRLLRAGDLHQNPQITEWTRLEGTSIYHLVKQGHPDHVVQDFICAGLKLSREGDSTSPLGSLCSITSQ